MSNGYLPEGRLLHTKENREVCASLASLQEAMHTEQVLEGRTILCTPEHDLSVRVGKFFGLIPREEVALGIREGTTREIAILTCVGKPISFVVSGIETDGSLRLSRRRAQELALSHLLGQPPGSVLPATITHMEGFGAFVDIGCGIISMIGIENCSVSRIPHPAYRFSVGQNIFAVITDIDRTVGRLYLSHKELLGTWLQNAAAFSPGMTVPGLVRGIKPYGSFIELTPNLTGLSDRTEGLSENDAVSVYIKAILPEQMKIKLSIIQKLAKPNAPAPLSYFITEGQVSHWLYSPPACTRCRIERSFSAMV